MWQNVFCMNCDFGLSLGFSQVREGGRGGGQGAMAPPQYFCPDPLKSLGQVVNDPILSHPCPKELD